MLTYELVTPKGTQTGKVDRIRELEDAVPRLGELVRQSMPVKEAYLHMGQKSFAFRVAADGRLAYAGKC